MDYSKNATVEEIRSRFDNDVERFSNLQTGQQTTVDAPITMELCVEAARYCNPDAIELLDVGCGAGNYTLKFLSHVPDLNCTLIDLSLPMLEKARDRVSVATKGTVSVIQEDIRKVTLTEGRYDVIFAAAVLHHLRDEEEWEHVFRKLYSSLKPGGSVWISDMVIHDSSALQTLFFEKYGSYIEGLKGKDYRKKVEEYIAYEDTPRSLAFQTELLKKVGFKSVEILHKHLNFAAFGGIK